MSILTSRSRLGRAALQEAIARSVVGGGGGTVALLALLLPLVACSSEISVTGLGPEGGATADLTLATIDGAGLPFGIDSTEDAIVEVVSGNLNLRQDGIFMRQTATRTTDPLTREADVVSETEVGSYVVNGETLTLAGRAATISGSLQGEMASLQIDGREWVYR